MPEATATAPGPELVPVRSQGRLDPGAGYDCLQCGPDLARTPEADAFYLAAAFSKALYTVELDAATGRTDNERQEAHRPWYRRPLPWSCPAASNFTHRTVAGPSLPVNSRPTGHSRLAGGLLRPGAAGPEAHPKHSAIAVSPDGKHAYVALWTYGYNALGLFSRNEQSGALTFVEKLAVDPNMVGINQIVFTADGKTGYYTSDPGEFRPVPGLVHTRCVKRRAAARWRRREIEDRPESFCLCRGYRHHLHGRQCEHEVLQYLPHQTMIRRASPKNTQIASVRTHLSAGPRGLLASAFLAVALAVPARAPPTPCRLSPNPKSTPP